MTEQKTEMKENTKEYIQRIENKIKDGQMDKFMSVYLENVFAYLTKQDGCLNAFFCVNKEKNAFQSIYYWKDKESFEKIGNPKINNELAKVAKPCKEFLDGQPNLSKWDVIGSY
eukprot:458021_1